MNAEVDAGRAVPRGPTSPVTQAAVHCLKRGRDEHGERWHCESSVKAPAPQHGCCGRKGGVGGGGGGGRGGGGNLVGLEVRSLLVDKVSARHRGTHERQPLLQHLRPHAPPPTPRALLSDLLRCSAQPRLWSRPSPPWALFASIPDVRCCSPNPGCSPRLAAICGEIRGECCGYGEQACRGRGGMGRGSHLVYEGAEGGGGGVDGQPQLRGAAHGARRRGPLRRSRVHQPRSRHVLQHNRVLRPPRSASRQRSCVLKTL